MLSIHQGLNCHLTSELLLPVAGDLAALCFYGLLAVGAGASSLPGAKPTVAFVGHTHAPLPVPAVRLALFLTCNVSQNKVEWFQNCLGFFVKYMRGKNQQFCAQINLRKAQQM